MSSEFEFWMLLIQGATLFCSILALWRLRRLSELTDAMEVMWGGGE